MNQLVFVTGAGRGIGRAIALKLAKAGYNVMACARTLSDLKETEKLGNGKIRIATLDVTDLVEVRDWVDSATTGHNSDLSLWGLVTAAGIQGPIGKLTENDWTEWKEGVEVNLFGTVAPSRAFAQKMIELKLPGRIVNLSGGGATQPQPHFSSYAASKAAVVRFSETLALELKSHRITVNSVAPGAVNTKFTEDVIQAGPEKVGKETYEKVLKQKASGGTSPDKAADLVSYLMSEKAHSVTGKLISAIWDPWEDFHGKKELFSGSDVYTLRRIVPEDRK